MAGELQAGLGLLSGLLSLPKTWEDERNRALLQNQMLASLAEKDPTTGQPTGPVPQVPVSGHFPGTQVPFLGGLLRGIGSVGQGLNIALGGQPPQAFDPQLLGMMLMQNRFTTGLGEKQHEFGIRQGELEEQRAWQRGFSEQTAKDREADRQVQLGLQQQIVNLRKEGSQPSDPAMRAWLAGPGKNASPEQIAAQEGKLRGLEKGLGATDPAAAMLKGAPTEMKVFFQGHPSLIGTPNALQDWYDARDSEYLKRLNMAREAKPLPAPVQQTVSSMESIRTAFARMKTMLLNDPDVAAGRGLAQGRFEQLAYTVGLAQPGQDPYLALQNLMRVVGAQPWMRNIRRYDMIQDIRQHLPKAGDKKELIQSKIDNLDMFGIETEAQALKFAATSIGAVPGLEKGLQAESQQKGYNLPAESFTVPPGTSGAPGPSGAAPAPGGMPNQGPVNMTPPPGGVGVPPTTDQEQKWHQFLDDLNVPRVPR